jgi:hypothetical protein
LAQLLRATYVWIAAFVEAQKPIHVAGQPDAHAFANCPSSFRGCSQPKRARRTQVYSVLPEINLYRSRQSPRTSPEIGQSSRAKGFGHALDPVKRLNGSQQDSAASARHLARHIEQER